MARENHKTLEIAVKGMDCASCAVHIKKLIEKLPGVDSAEVFLSAEKAVVHFDPSKVDVTAIKNTVENLGYSVGDEPSAGEREASLTEFTRRAFQMFWLVFGAVLFIVVVGEWLGLFEAITEKIPELLAVPIILFASVPILWKVVKSASQGRILSHTLMSVGFLAALLVGEWPASAVVLFFMHIGDYTERFTAERARKAVKELTSLIPRTARVERDGIEKEVPVAEVRAGEMVIVLPGKKIPVDGEVLDGDATVDQSIITGESMPVEVGPGSRVFAATIATMGRLKVKATHIGPDSTFGRVIRMVEQAEANRAEVQRVADRFSGYYLPVVLGIAVLTFLFRKDPLSAAAVLVVACSCSFAIATPIAIMASIGAGAKRGLLIKGGKYLEIMSRVCVLLLDKTGTLTFGKPQIVDIIPLNETSEKELLSLAASAERYSEHPLAEAIRHAAKERNVPIYPIQYFKPFPGLGVCAEVNGKKVIVGNRKMVLGDGMVSQAEQIESEGKTSIFVAVNGELVGILGAADTVRPEVPEALQAVQAFGVHRMEILTGDNEQTAEALAKSLGVSYRANLLPEQKIDVVKEYQAKGHTVVMVGDGVNDAPALAQANVGIAMGAAGSDVAMEAAHIALMREDWALIPKLFSIARRTVRVIYLNIGFTVIFNLVGISLAALGYLPLIFAAALQSMPDLGILANSSRLLKQ